MKPIRDMWLIQIEVTNACDKQCANCTRFIGHHRKPFFMDLKMIENAIDSLEGFPGKVGIMGGEPTLHPQFPEICKLIQRKLPSGRCGLWTSGYKWQEYKSLIKNTFNEFVFYNDHSGKGQTHQPILIAIAEVLDDKEFMWELIDQCWVQDRWSASITPKGGFFCEVAAAMDILFEGPGGYPVEKGWWDKTPEQFYDQVERFCPRCSGALPLIPISNEGFDLISPRNYEELKRLKSPRVINNSKVYIVKTKYSKEQILKFRENWKPWEYLGEDGIRSTKDLYGSIALYSIRSFRGRIKRKTREGVRKVKIYFEKYFK